MLMNQDVDMRQQNCVLCNDIRYAASEFTNKSAGSTEFQLVSKLIEPNRVLAIDDDGRRKCYYIDTGLYLKCIHKVLDQLYTGTQKPDWKPEIYSVNVFANTHTHARNLPFWQRHRDGFRRSENMSVWSNLITDRQATTRNATTNTISAMLPTITINNKFICVLVR